MKRKILELISPAHPWYDRVHVLESVDSTNSLAHAMAKEGAPHGTVIIAKMQTGGRGRMGRSFYSPANMGVYMTVILRPECAPTELMHLTCAAGVAMCDAVAAAVGSRPRLKWANDLVVGTRKLGGILTELSLEGAKVAYALIGIGINCCGSSRDFPPELQNAVTTAEEAYGPVSREDLAAAMIESLTALSNELLRSKKDFMHRYRQDCITPGNQISILRGDTVRHATALDVDDDGGLLVEFADGSRETIASGEVSIRGMYGYVN